MRLNLIFAVALAPLLLGLAGCQALPEALRGGERAAVTAESPITGGPIAVTSLDGPAPTAASATGPATTAAQAPPSAVPDDDDPPPLAPVPDTMPQADAPPQAAEPVAPVAIKTAAHLACEKRGGRWSVAGGGSAAFCQQPTRDAGKSCQRSTDCAGYCLEKSRTCAPVTPMLGCHDILNETGRMLTQCIN